MNERGNPDTARLSETDKNGPPPVIMALAPPVIADFFPRAVFDQLGCDIRYANSIFESRTIAEDDMVDIAILPLDVNGHSVLPLVRDLMKRNPRQAIIVVSQSDQINDAAEAMRLGAMDCIFVPFTQNRLQKTVGNVLQTLRRTDTPDTGRRKPSPPSGSRAPLKNTGTETPATTVFPWIRHGMVLSDLSMKPVLRALDTVASTNAPIYIHGETGTGKELLARALHAESSRSAGPFTVVDCARLDPETLAHGCFSEDAGHSEGATGGTLFLDEIARTDLRVQKQLMRFLDNSDAALGPHATTTAKARIICASTEDARTEIDAGRLLEDLYHRLHVVPISLPALRDRGEDILAIANAKLVQIARQEGRRFQGFTASAADILMSHPWPGNVRQLINVIWNIVLHHDGDTVTAEMLPVDLLAGLPDRGANSGQQRSLADTGLLGRPLAEIERMVIEETIRAQGGSIPRAAQVLDVSPSTIYRKRDNWARS